MATNLQTDDKLITRAAKPGHHRTKKAAVTQALTDYIQHLEQEKILSLFGSVDYSPGYNYNKQRARIVNRAARPRPSGATRTKRKPGNAEIRTGQVNLRRIGRPIPSRPCIPRSA